MTDLDWIPESADPDDSTANLIHNLLSTLDKIKLVGWWGRKGNWDTLPISVHIRNELFSWNNEYEILAMMQRPRAGPEILGPPFVSQVGLAHELEQQLDVCVEVVRSFYR